MSEKQLSRRDFLRSAAKVSAGAVVGAGLVSACSTKAEPTAAPATAAPAAAAAATTAPAAAPAQEAKRDINVCWRRPHQRLHRRGRHRDAQRRRDGR